MAEFSAVEASPALWVFASALVLFFLPSGLGVNVAGGGVADWWVKQLEQLRARKRLAEEQNHAAQQEFPKDR